MPHRKQKWQQVYKTISNEIPLNYFDFNAAFILNFKLKGIVTKY